MKNQYIVLLNVIVIALLLGSCMAEEQGVDTSISYQSFQDIFDNSIKITRAKNELKQAGFQLQACQLKVWASYKEQEADPYLDQPYVCEYSKGGKEKLQLHIMVYLDPVANVLYEGPVYIKY